MENVTIISIWLSVNLFIFDKKCKFIFFFLKKCKFIFLVFRVFTKFVGFMVLPSLMHLCILMVNDMTRVTQLSTTESTVTVSSCTSSSEAKAKRTKNGATFHDSKPKTSSG